MVRDDVENPWIYLVTMGRKGMTLTYQRQTERTANFYAFHR
jgi:hypothetical protein